MAVNIALDGGLAALAVTASFWLANPQALWAWPHVFPLAGALAIWLIGIPFGLWRLRWRFVSFRDLAMLAAAGIVTALMLALLMTGAGLPLPSPAFPAILALVLATCLTAPKFCYRLLREPSAGHNATTQQAILVGTPETAELFLAAHAQNPAKPYCVAGLLALSPKHVGQRLHGLDIVGAVDNAAAALARQKPDLLIITTPDLGGTRLQALLAAAARHGTRVMRAPCLTHLAPAEQQAELRPIALEDLLNRQPVRLDRAGMTRLIAGQRVLVTGAGGSIGAELVRQLAALSPAELLLLDNNEFALWRIELELSELHPQLPRRVVIADIRDEPRIRAVMREFRPALVFHAAALKHVPMVEANKLEGLRTNALGTRIVADAAAASGTGLMVLISTDKAVNPSSVMGASKRVAEMYAQALDVAARHAGEGMRCVTVRFGNVLGSTGSVVPLFRHQLAQGGPLTVTHPDMHRYFMTVREAVGLVLQASVSGSGAEAIPDGGIFMLDMGEPVRIVDLARNMIRLAGLRPDEDIKIAFTGMRPGEKLCEELFHGHEQPVPSGHEGLLMVTPRTAELRAMSAAMDELATAPDEARAMAVVEALVPEFLPPAGLAVSAAAE
jgi:O-antigen biosynthesis protein WbqV